MKTDLEKQIEDIKKSKENDIPRIDQLLGLVKDKDTFTEEFKKCLVDDIKHGNGNGFRKINTEEVYIPLLAYEAVKYDTFPNPNEYDILRHIFDYIAKKIPAIEQKIDTKQER